MPTKADLEQRIVELQAELAKKMSAVGVRIKMSSPEQWFE
jgi:hypothetical protein